MASLQRSATCPRCGIKLISPEWSKTVSAYMTLSLWRCPICGKDFETTDYIVEETQSISQPTKPTQVDA